MRQYADPGQYSRKRHSTENITLIPNDGMLIASVDVTTFHWLILTACGKQLD
jgi:hypothetical protein